MIKFLLFVLIFFTSGISWGMQINSNAFKNNSIIPNEYTCQKGVSPELSWSQVPANTRSLAIILEDPDSPSKVWSHWVVFNIPPTRTSFEKGQPKTDKLDDGSIQGTNDYHKIGYDGPCPPPGKPHHYYFTVFALDSTILLSSNATMEDLKKAMVGHVIAESSIIGIFGR